MEELFGLIIFGIIAAISGLAKLLENRKEEALRRERGSRSRVDELPEATRRMLYGEGGPPVARRRGEGEAEAPPVAVPRRQEAPAPPRRQEAPPPVPRRRAAPQQVPPQAQRRPVAPAPQRESRQAQRTLQENWQRAQRQAQPQPAPRTTREERPAAPERTAQRRPTTAGRRRGRSSIQALLHHPKTLRTSIILHEVLSPPKSLR